jgi:hypothetical protein
VSAVVALVAEARASGHQLRVADGKVKVTGKPERGLLERLRQHKAELVELLDGRRCRHCGEPVTDQHWRHRAGALALPFADGMVAHVECHEQAEVDRILAAARRAVRAELADDPGEVALRGEIE